MEKSRRMKSNLRYNNSEVQERIGVPPARTFTFLDKENIMDYSTFKALIVSRLGTQAGTRFLSKIYISNTECWIWENKSKLGYGTFSLNGKTAYTHRFSFEVCNGELKRGYCVCHKCDTPSCVNPDHLFSGTRLDNNRDAINKGRFWFHRYPDKLEYIRKNPPRNRAKGESITNAKLTESQVREIRKLCSQGMPRKQVAQMMQVSICTIRDIVNKKTWRHIID